MTLRQARWRANSAGTDSTGTPLVSGTKKKTSTVMTATQPPKNRKTPHSKKGRGGERGERRAAAPGGGASAAQAAAAQHTRAAAGQRRSPASASPMAHIMDRKAWPMTKENKKLTWTANDMPAARVSMLWISDGTSQPRGPARGARERGAAARRRGVEAAGEAAVGARHGGDSTGVRQQVPTGSRRAARTPGPGKGRHVDGDDDQQADGHALGQVGGGVGLELDCQDDAGDDLRGREGAGERG